MSKRDYRAEYARRISRLEAQGFSRSQARGHVKTKTIDDERGGRRTIRLERSIRTERVREKVETDRRAAFGDLPKRERGETAAHYDKRLDDARKEHERSAEYDPDREPAYDWDDFEGFLDSMLDDGLNEHEAYDLWFGY